MYDVKKITVFYKDGVDFYGEPTKDSLHSLYLKDYCAKYHVAKDVIDDANKLIASLVNNRDIVVSMNSVLGYSEYNNTKYKGYIFVALPNSISEELYNKLVEYEDFFNLFDEIIVTRVYNDDNNVGTCAITEDGETNFIKLINSIEKGVKVYGSNKTK